MKLKAQTIIEFCFAGIVLMVLVFGMVQTVRWVMMDLAERRYDHDSSLIRNKGPHFDPSRGQLLIYSDAKDQLSPYFHDIRHMDTVAFKRCNPDCTSNVCGAPDSCGGQCDGACSDPTEGCVAGVCKCIPACDGKNCGDADGCGGGCPNQTCGDGWKCSGGGCVCVPSCKDAQCGAMDSCNFEQCLTGSCAVGSCVNGVCQCVPKCAGKDCGADDECGGKCLSGWCQFGLCQPDGQCQCTPVCNTCGEPDGCNGTCQTGACASGEICVAGVCSKNGYWSSWLDAGACSVECGGGTKPQQRFCIYPDLANPGKDCSEIPDGAYTGMTTRDVACTMPSCCNPNWLTTSQTQCSVECGYSTNTVTQQDGCGNTRVLSDQPCDAGACVDSAFVCLRNTCCEPNWTTINRYCDGTNVIYQQNDTSCEGGIRELSSACVAGATCSSGYCTFDVLIKTTQFGECAVCGKVNGADCGTPAACDYVKANCLKCMCSINGTAAYSCCDGLTIDAISADAILKSACPAGVFSYVLLGEIIDVVGSCTDPRPGEERRMFRVICK